MNAPFFAPIHGSGTWQTIALSHDAACAYSQQKVLELMYKLMAVVMGESCTIRIALQELAIFEGFGAARKIRHHQLMVS